MTRVRLKEFSDKTDDELRKTLMGIRAFRAGMGLKPGPKPKGKKKREKVELTEDEAFTI